MLRLELGPCSAEPPALSLPPPKWIWQSRGGARAWQQPGEGGKEGGRQLGVVGRTFLPLSLANPNPRLQAALQSPGLLRHRARIQPAVGGRKGSLSLARAGGTGRGGRPGRGSGVRTRRAPCTTQREAQLRSPLESQTAELGEPWRPNPSTPTNRWRPGCQRDAETQSGHSSKPVHSSSSPHLLGPPLSCRLTCHYRKKNTRTQQSSSRSPALVPAGTEHP